MVTPRQRSVLIIVGGMAIVGVIHAGMSPARQQADRVDRLLSRPRTPDFKPSLGAPAIRVVCFFDVECASCATIVPVYLKVIERFRNARPGLVVAWDLKHYPLESECNPLVTRNATLGCESAVVLEGLLETRASDATSAAITLMNSRRESLEQMGGLFGLDLDWLRTHYRRLLAKVATDVASGAANGVLATPTVFVNGLRLRAPDGEMLGSVLDHEARVIEASRVAR